MWIKRSGIEDVKIVEPDGWTVKCIAVDREWREPDIWAWEPCQSCGKLFYWIPGNPTSCNTCQRRERE